MSKYVYMKQKGMVLEVDNKEHWWNLKPIAGGWEESKGDSGINLTKQKPNHKLLTIFLPSLLQSPKKDV